VIANFDAIWLSKSSGRDGRKDSAEGTLSIEEALNAFSVDSIVAAKQNANNKEIFENILEGKKSKQAK